MHEKKEIWDKMGKIEKVTKWSNKLKEVIFPNSVN